MTPMIFGKINGLVREVLPHCRSPLVNHLNIALIFELANDQDKVRVGIFDDLETLVTNNIVGSGCGCGGGGGGGGDIDSGR